MRVFTVGHSNHPLDHFLQLLCRAEITAIIDVRSSPRSWRFPQFGQGSLNKTLDTLHIGYVLLGDKLGGLPRDPALFSRGRADYELMAASPSFQEGIAQVIERAAADRVALLCSEHEPLECHRCVLVGRHLVQRGVGVEHILRTGQIEPHRDTEERLLVLRRRDLGQQLTARGERLAAAYQAQAQRIAPEAPPK